jgi:ribose transport system permease protein
MGVLAGPLRGLGRVWMPLAILAAMLVITAIFSPDFFQVRNVLNVTRQASIVGVIAVGMTLVILTGGIDLSVGSILALSTVVMAMLLNDGTPLGVALVACIAVGGVVGALNGMGIALLGIQPFIMTLATMVMVRGVALRLSDGAPQPFSAESGVVDFFGSGDVGGIPGPVIIFLGIALAGWAMLRYLPFGRFLYAIGGSKEAARLSGVRTSRTLVGAYSLSGLCAGVAGAMTACRLSVGDPTAGNLAELDAIAAVVIGGTSLLGGVGGMVGTVAGAGLLAVLANVLNLAGVSPFDQLIAKGLVIVIAVLLAARATRRRLSERRVAQVGVQDPQTQDSVLGAEAQSRKPAS